MSEMTTRVLGILIAAIAVLCSGCGGGHDQSVQTRQHSAAEEETTYLNAGKPPKVRVEGRSVCTRAQVRIGPRPGAIDFVAHCVGLRRGGPIDFVVSRGETQHVDPQTAIIGYSRTPNVTGPRATVRRADCGLEEGSVECGVEARGRIRVAGRIWVKPSTRCGASVSVVGITVPPCEGNFCEGDPKLHEVFRGRPRGC